MLDRVAEYARVRGVGMSCRLLLSPQQGCFRNQARTAPVSERLEKDSRMEPDPK